MTLDEEKLDKGSRVIFVEKDIYRKQIQLYISDTTSEPQIYPYDIHDDQLVIWVADQGFSSKIKELSNETLILEAGSHKYFKFERK